MALAEGGAGVGWLRDLQPAALVALASIVDQANKALTGQRPRTCFGQNADGSIFFVATGIDAPFKVRWAFLTREGVPHERTWYEEESAVREACRIGPWDINQLLDRLGTDEVDIDQLQAR